MTSGAATSRALRELEGIQGQYGPGLAARKCALLRRLGRARFATPAALARWHESICWLRAYSDNRAVLAAAEAQARAFAQRPDLRRHRLALESTGIAGTDIRYAFFADTARWMARRWPGRLEVDWDEFPAAKQELLEGRLGLITHLAESPAVDESSLGLRDWVSALRGPREADGGALGRALDALAESPASRDVYQDELDVPMVLRWGNDSPSRTLARFAGAPAQFQSGPMRSGRPDLAAELLRPPVSIQALDLADGRAAIALARGAMVTRERDLDAFANGDPRDVRLVDCGGGLSFLAIGIRPDRRLLLESVYGFLTLKNGVPIGYVLTSALFGSSEIAYNVFETYRGGEAAWVYARVLAMTRAIFGSEVFTIYPSQLGGEGNQEGLQSGSWWFYQKLGFRARDAGVLRLMRRELARMRGNPAHRSSIPTLKKLAAHNVYLESGLRRNDVMGALRADRIGLAVTRYLSKHYGGDRRAAAGACAEEAAALLGAKAWRSWPDEEQRAFSSWSPLLLILPGVTGWSAAERRAAVAVMRAKGGRRESDFVRLLDRHSRLRGGLAALAARPARSAQGKILPGAE